MAVMTMDFYSKELKMSTLLTMIVPDSIRIEQTPVSQRKCLYLLHGLSDDASAYLRLSKVELYAMETGIVIIMPSAGRSMYCDGINGQNWFSHIANEVPEYLKLVMGISPERKNSYIAGISMGGMGAAKVALTYPERYTKVGLFSGLLDIKMLAPLITEEQKLEFPFLVSAADDVDNTPLNPINLLDAKKHKDLEILVRCGEQDELFLMSQTFCERAKGLNLNITSVYEEGKHEWRLWDRYLDDFIKEMAV